MVRDQFWTLHLKARSKGLFYSYKALGKPVPSFDTLIARVGQAHRQHRMARTNVRRPRN